MKQFKSLALIFLVFTFIIPLLAIAFSPGAIGQGTASVVTFPDANLEAAIRQALSKPTSDITAADLAALTVLNAHNKNIVNLSGLEYCVNLTWLDLLVNQISDISPLSNLTSLSWLSLGINQISDISALSNLTSLTRLYLDINQISDISALSNLTSLTWLILNNNPISDIPALSNLTSLTRLILGSNQISDISALSSLTNLAVLTLGDNQISDISALSNLTSLTWLGLGNNQISDISALSNLTSLTGLYLGNNQISDILPLVENSGLGAGDEIWLENNNLQLWEGSGDLQNIRVLQGRGVLVHHDPIGSPPVVTFPDANLEAAIRQALSKPTGDITAADLAALTSLSASSRNIVNLSGLEYCVNLTRLYLGNNQISDISPLLNLTSLTVLQLAYNRISDISALSSLTSLIELSLYGNQISDISPLSNLNNLTRLYLGSNQISNISAIDNLTSLTKLNLGNNQIGNISALDNLTSLIELGLYNNQISDISPLSNLTSLTVLELSYNQISDVSALSSLTSLIWLYLHNNQISDVSPLSNLNNLIWLILRNNQISDISLLVENSGLGAGDRIWLENNNLQLWEGSEDLQNIRILQGRGAVVSHDPIGSLPEGAIEGWVYLQGRTNHAGTDIYLNGVKTAITDGNGHFIITTLLPVENYTLRAKKAGYLDAEKSGVNVIAGYTTTMPAVTLPAGDADSNGTIDISDLSIIGASFNTSPPADERADINADNVVDIYDLALPALNLGKSGCVPWTM